MGWRYEVHAWTNHDGGGYSYTLAYQGQSALKAFVAARKAKKHSGCVRIEWR